MRGILSGLYQAPPVAGLPSSAFSPASRSFGLIAGVLSYGAGPSSSFISAMKRDGSHE